eukprot:4124107-Amphidinium_carterae.1
MSFRKEFFPATLCAYDEETLDAIGLTTIIGQQLTREEKDGLNVVHPTEYSMRTSLLLSISSRLIGATEVPKEPAHI